MPTVAAKDAYGCSLWHLRLQAERHTLTEVLRISAREISITFETATTDALRTLVTMGTRALHYSGHGEGALEPYPSSTPTPTPTPAPAPAPSPSPTPTLKLQSCLQP